MGNSGSSHQPVLAQPPHSWAHSYPRSPQKVLPERVPGQRLRVTDNGAILQNGGTISGRNQHQLRPRSASQGSQHNEISRHSMYGSEPDLRFAGHDFQSYNHNDSPAKLRISRTRKKYKAPPAPQLSNGLDSSSPDSYQHWEQQGGGGRGGVVPPTRRLRLFKTRAESKRPRGESPLQSPSHSIIPPPGPLQRSLSTPQFQAELMEVTKRLRRGVREPPIGKAAESPPSSPAAIRSRESRYSHSSSSDFKGNIRSPLREKEQSRSPAREKKTDRRIQGREFHSSPARESKAEVCRPDRVNRSVIQRPARENRLEVQRPARENRSEIQRPARENRSEVQRPARENTSEVQRPARENKAEVQRPARENRAEVQRPVREHRSEVQRPAKENRSEVLRPARENRSEVQRPARENRPELQRPSRENRPELQRLGRENRIDVQRPAREKKQEQCWESKTDKFSPTKETNSGSPSKDLEKSGKLRNTFQMQHHNVSPLSVAQTKSDEARNRVNRDERPKVATGRSVTPEPDHIRPTSNDNSWHIIPTTKPSAPVKTFYFGMTNGLSQPSDDWHETGENEVVDRFAASIQKRVPAAANTANTSGSDSVVSETLDESPGSISLQLRPTLPRKQLDIPRFSPTAAWRLLSAAGECPTLGGGGSGGEEDDDPDERIPAPPPYPLPHPHPLLDKSGDSGISGDASPIQQDSYQAAWTPQQDLEETSSDGGLESAPVSPESLPTAKFTPRFSLSLPRDDRLALYTPPDKEPQQTPSSFHSLKKLKRSMSGALGRVGNKENGGLPLDTNWVLSRSVPNSLNNGHQTMQRWSDTSPSSPEQDDDVLMTSLVKPPSFSYLATGGHVMYLPEYSIPKKSREQTLGALAMSKSCEDLSRDIKEEEANLSASVKQALDSAARPRSGRKFTFQSTVRQIERRRIADRLSREAEQKERQRLGELEAMRRVEEEFQRKREREKADIRQQLRLFSLTQSRVRAQPDGAEPPSPTKVLSEFRQPRRDYRDYRHPRVGHSELDTPLVREASPKLATVHPQVVYQMPKSTQVYVVPHSRSNGSGGSGDCGTPRSSSSDNYRRHFAQGALPHSLASSDSELSQPNTRPASRTRF